MGIGNIIVVSNSSELVDLITPHGDWEPAARLSASNQLPDSLPLMGIGNDERKRTDWEWHFLITPHGDWEHFGCKRT